MTPSAAPDAQRGFWAALGAYAWWGSLPLYFRSLHGVPSMEVVAHRVVWSLLLVMGILLIRRSLSELITVFRSRTLLLPLVASALLIAGNWLIYVWAVNAGHVVAASLGYYLIPMLNVLMGYALLGERLSRVQWLAVAFAGAGVAVLAAGALTSLWIGVSLALTFGIYGLIRKLIPTGPLVGLAAETVLLAPVALAALLWWQWQGNLAFGQAGPATNWLLVASGIITTVPLLMFAYGAQRLTLVTLGLLQYVGPTIQLAIGLFLFNEPLTLAHTIAFPLIWCGLALYSWASLRQRRPAQPA
ncbi:EamA family transporter RarD [Sphingomonas lacunae]|uniref:EamA family transporter RarD n=1 Tax=Sphingomonas lacunae TaxID=2698828 RepID=A0A6M4AV90_9SPHN|nr:EamA family transporter RarD [Sphingomonas lacunae]QJQ32330.1 EamA family transporter RarD [Sphingomonas lacunae]